MYKRQGNDPPFGNVDHEIEQDQTNATPTQQIKFGELVFVKFRQRGGHRNGANGSTYSNYTVVKTGKDKDQNEHRNTPRITNEQCDGSAFMKKLWQVKPKQRQ